MPRYAKAPLPARTGQRELFIDIETRSRVDLRKSSVYRYVECPDFRILMAAYAVDDGPVEIAFGADINRIPGLWDSTVTKVAHNAAFERVCFSVYAGRPVGSYLIPDTWHDTAAVAAELGYPRKLEQLAKALGGEEKDGAGTHLINWFCKPDPRTGEFRRPEDHPEKWQQFCEYCKQDVVTHRDAHRRMGGWPTPDERELFIADQHINDRGMAVDLGMARAGAEAVTKNNTRDLAEMARLTGLENPNSIAQLGGWLAERATGERIDHKLGEPDAVPFTPLDNMRAETIEAALSGPLPDDVAQVLTLRQNIALAASKKFGAAVVAANSDGRLRGGFKFFGAHTGRWSGSGVQPHNLTSTQYDTEDETEGAILDLKLGEEITALDLKKLVRALFTGPLTVVDYAAIEARVVAWLAGEGWALEAFREGRDIYVETAERMSTDTRTYTRKDGKVAVLALGYNGGPNAMRAMGAAGTDEELAAIVSQWRAANARIARMWKQMETAFRTGGPVGDHLVVERDGDTRCIRLPSGRGITYRHVKHRWVDTDYGRRLQASFADPARSGARTGTYGGRLTENVTQAVARDVLAAALTRLDRTPHKVVGHVHDEILIAGTPTVAEITKHMVAPLPWSDGLPIDAAGFTCRRYRKD